MTDSMAMRLLISLPYFNLLHNHYQYVSYPLQYLLFLFLNSMHSVRKALRLPSGACTWEESWRFLETIYNIIYSHLSKF